MKTFITRNSWKKEKLRFFPILLLGLILSLGCLFLVSAPVSAATQYIFSTFDGDGASEQKLFIYTSADGLNWGMYANTGFTGPTGVLRDPSIIKNPGDGKYYIAYTVYSYTTQSTYFNIASSSDLKNWTHVASVNAGVSGTQYTWAPEFFLEGSTVRIIASLSPSNSPWSFVAYYYTAQNTSLTSWSGPTRMAGIGPNIIDSYVVKSGNTYHAFTQNGNTLYIEHATASSLAGPWTYTATGNWAGWGSGKEGPCLFQQSNGTWTLFADWYSTNGIYKATSSNLTSWSSLTSVGTLSSKRHGTVFPDPNFTLPVYYKLVNRASGKCLDNMGGTADGADVFQWENSGSWNQQWQWVDAGGGYYKFICRTGGKCLDSMGRTTDGSVVGQYGNGSSYNQQWRIEDVGGGYVKIINRNSGKCLDTGGSTTNGSPMQMWGSGANYNQQWQLVGVNQ